jgi:hypothetical protein
MPESSWLHRNVTRRLGRYIHPLWPGEIREPVFIVGCPRSGTSVFGRILGNCPGFLYLMEPRYIWCSVDPRLNVWGAEAGGGVLYWDQGDVRDRQARQLRQWFHLALTLSGQRRLVEKLPLNVFRLRWLAAIFPDARFIHLVRHAREVALSLEEAVRHWFRPELGYPSGYWESNWNYLMFEDYAERQPELHHKLELVRTQNDNYARSLFVWLCSVWEGRGTGQELGRERFLQLRYEDLIRSPETELGRVLAFLGEPTHQETLDHARAVLHGRSVRKPDPRPEITEALAGRLLRELGYEVQPGP